MELNGIKKFISTLEKIGVTDWEAITDTAPTHYYNNDSQVNLIDEDNEMMYNFAKGLPSSPYNGQIVVRGSHLSDIHEVSFGCDNIQILNKFIKEYGLSATESQSNVLLKINTVNNNIIPQTGDYLTFEKSIESKLNTMSKEDRDAYIASDQFELDKAEWEKQRQTPRRAAIINV